MTTTCYDLNLFILSWSFFALLGVSQLKCCPKTREVPTKGRLLPHLGEQAAAGMDIKFVLFFILLQCQLSGVNSTKLRNLRQSL